MSILKSHSERIIFINIRVAVGLGKGEEKELEATPAWLSCQLCVRHVRVCACVCEACLLPAAAAGKGTRNRHSS